MNNNTDDIEEIEELRPIRFQDFVGQNRLKELLINYINFHQTKGKVMDHILLTGPAGLGKSTIARIVGEETGVQFFRSTGPSLRKIEDIITVMNFIKRGDILFIDEVHRLNKNVEHFLFTIMTEFHYSVTIKLCGEWGVLEKDLPKFTVVGATTQPGELDKPFLQRFGFKERLEYYTLEELIEIIFRSAKILGITIWREGALGIAERSRFTPRIANHILKRINEYAWSKGRKELNKEIIEQGSKALGIDKLGLDNVDRAYENYLANMDGGPCGIKNIASAIEEDIDTIEELHEPYMIKIGHIKKTAKGRVLLRKGFEHLGKDIENIINKKGEEIGGKYRYDDDEVTNIPSKEELKKRKINIR